MVSTPIGNLGDITERVKVALTESSLVLAEDTRVTQKLLFRFESKARLMSCHEHNEESRARLLEDAAREDRTVALVSDAGTPLVSDPGYQIVRRAIELGMRVVPIPGPSAALAALVGSGLPSDRFAFEGFLPDKAGDRRKRLEHCRSDDKTLIFFVAPSQLESILSEMQSVFGDRQACIARELTKMYEEFVRGTLSELKAHIARQGIRGEYVLVVAGAAEQARETDEATIRARLQELLAGGGRLKEIASLLARETTWASSDIYKLGLSIKEGMSDEP